MAPPREKSAVSDADALTDGQTASGYVSGYTTEEAPDYDEVSSETLSNLFAF
jgi:glycerol-3-phosphate O-acyltransferase/dihydroxyacetone phosphate acyltransferase